MTPPFTNRVRACETFAADMAGHASAAGMNVLGSTFVRRISYTYLSAVTAAVSVAWLTHRPIAQPSQPRFPRTSESVLSSDPVTDLAGSGRSQSGSRRQVEPVLAFRRISYRRTFPARSRIASHNTRTLGRQSSSVEEDEDPSTTGTLTCSRRVRIATAERFGRASEFAC